jgi:DNA-binding NarL/FixJ family response regulator
MTKTPEKTLSVAIVEDENLFRDLLRIALASHQKLIVVGSFGNAETAFREIPELKPDIALLDIDLSGEMNGVELGVELRNKLPNLGVVLLSNHQDIEFIASLDSRILAGWSYLLKKSVRNADVLLRAIEGASDGMTVLDPQLVKSRISSRSPLSSLTARQLDVLALIAQGYTNAAVGTQLNLSQKTVENVVNAIYQALEIPTQAQIHPRVKAVLMYLEALRGG